MAGDYMAMTGISPSRYMVLFKQSMQIISSHISGEATIVDDNTQYPIAAFEVSFSLMERRDYRAVDLLYTCSYLHHDSICYDLIWRGLGLDPDGELPLLTMSY